jgi:hypothetical protein
VEGGLRYQKQAFGEGEKVVLDGSTFTACSFYKTCFEYSGGALPEFIDCRMEDCNLKLTESAGRTAAFLKRIAERNSGGVGAVLGILGIDPALPLSSGT